MPGAAHSTILSARSFASEPEQTKYTTCRRHVKKELHQEEACVPRPYVHACKHN